MRRMRDFFNGWVITLVITAGIGYFAVRHWPTHQTTAATDAAHPAGASREIATEAEGKTHKGKAHTKTEQAKPEADEGELTIEEHEIAELDHGSTKPLEHTAATATHETATTHMGGTREACSPIEYRGNTPQAGRISTDQWDKVMSQFHYAKRDILTWLDRHRGDFPKEISDHMEGDVKELRLQRPPTPDYPDLAVRGMGIWTRPSGERPIIKVGGGFAKLAEHHPERARFELTRLIAQTWSPCELRRSPVAGKFPAEGPWHKLMTCLGVQEDLTTACAPGGFSEGGWAVSTAIAAVAAPAGCTIPAFAAPMGDRCLDDLRTHEMPRAPASKSTGKGAHHE
jgi:hypothetical protein